MNSRTTATPADTTASARRIIAGSLLAGLAVVFGAFAAHGLDGFLTRAWPTGTKTIAGQEFAASWKYLQDFKTAAEYQMYHALGLILVGLLTRSGSRRSLTVAAWSFGLGILLFSGSLYLLVLTQQTWLGMITPLGGTLFIIGWVAVATAAASGRSAAK